MNTPQRPFQVWLTVVRREYVTRVRRRAFLVATLLGPVLWVGLVAGLVLLTQSTESPAKVWVVDHDGLLTAPAEGGQFVPTCPSCYPERTLLTYRFGREPKDAATLEAEGFTCMVEVGRRHRPKREGPAASLGASHGTCQALDAARPEPGP